MMNRIAVFGVGAIGSLISKYLITNPDNQVYFFNRSPKNQIRINHDSSIFEAEIKLQDPFSFQEPLDWLIICLKEHQYEIALDSIAQLISPATQVAVFRNGLHLKESLKSLTVDVKILETIIDCPMEQMNKEQYHQLRHPKIILPNSELSQSFSLLFKIDEMEFVLSSDFKTEQWKKVIESAGLGSLQIKFDGPCGKIKQEKPRQLYADFIKECIEVAKKDGAQIKGSFIEELIQKLMSYPDDKTSSMYRDYILGNPLELNAKNGPILNVAKKYELHTPINESLCLFLFDKNMKD